MSGYSGDAVFGFRLHCANCGALLKIKRGTAQVADDVEARAQEPVDPNVVAFIEPCADCIDRLVGPALEFARALERLRALGERLRR